MTTSLRAPLIVITGPTASGKSSLALKLAKKWGGEIICADSRTVYKGMDIGTAKPIKSDQNEVRHWLIDVVEPDQRFTAADFQKLACDAIRDIRSRNKIPFLVGGTGLYIDAVVLNFVFGSEADFAKRLELERCSIEELQLLISKQHKTLPENSKNKRYLIRCIENDNGTTSVNNSLERDTLVFALDTSKEVLQTRIVQRIDTMFADEIVQETQQLFEKYGSNHESMTGNIYRIVSQMIAGDIDEDTAKELCVIRDRQLAKRQVTWLKRHGYVRWAEPDEIERQVEQILTKFVTPEQFSDTMVDESKG